MTPPEQLHLDAAAYAHKRIDTYNEALRGIKLKPLTKKLSGELWLASYEGYVAGYEAKLKEKNT